MLYRFILFLFISNTVFAVTPKELYGTWETQRQSQNRSTYSSEHDSITFRPATVSLELTVNLKRGSAYIKNLRVHTQGIWKVKGDILVIVWQDLRVVGYEESKGINEASIQKLGTQLRGRYLDDPIRIFQFQSIDRLAFRALDENQNLKEYKRSR